MYIWIVFGPICVYAAPPLPVDRIDSLRTLAIQYQDTALADIYNQLSWDYRNIDADTAMYYGRLGYALSKELHYARGASEGLNYMGIAHRNKSDYSEAMELFFEALKVSEDANDQTQLNYTLINIGNIYLYQQNYHSAIQYFEQTLKNAGKLADDRLKAYSHLNLGRALIGQEKFELAKKHIYKCIEIRSQLEDREGVAIAKVDLAEIYRAEGQLQKSLEMLISNMKDVISLGDKNTLAYSHISIAEILYQQKKYDLAILHIQDCMKIGQSGRMKNVEVRGLKILAKIYEAQGKSASALRIYKQYMDKKDSIFNEENTEKIAQAFSQYTIEKSENEKLNLQERYQHDEEIIQRQRTTIALSIVSTILFFVIALVSIRSAIIRKQLNEQIQEQKEAAFTQNNTLIDLNNEKNNLIRILSHDLRAPINNIKGLTQVHQMDHDFTESENETLNMIKSESDRLLNMITKILNVEALSDENHEVELTKVDMRSIAIDVAKSFKTAAESKGIKIETFYTDEPVYVLGDEVHMRQIMENLLSNAIKFTEQNRIIELLLRAVANRIKFEVKDQGPGLTEEDKDRIFKKFQTLSAKPTGNEDSTGLGLSIVKRYTEEMNGKIWYESTLGKGTTFTVEFDRVEAPRADKPS